MQRKVLVVTNKKEDLREALRAKEQELQAIRTMMPSLSSSGADPDIIREKKREMNKLKKDIEELQYELQKEKISK